LRATGIRGRTRTGYDQLEGLGARAALHSRTEMDGMDGKSTKSPTHWPALTLWLCPSMVPMAR